MIEIEKIEDKWPEKALLLYTSKVTISDNEKRIIRKIVGENEINWFEFVKLAMFHKTVTLCWKNIISICQTSTMPTYLSDFIYYTYICTKKRNIKNLEKVKEIVHVCKKQGIICIPVKGVFLLDCIYKDYGLRYSGDMDFLVKYEDTNELKEILEKLGYVNGRYSIRSKNIESFSREEEIMWKAHLGNLPPFLKLSESEFFPTFKLDFRFALDDEVNKEPIREIVDTTKRKGYTLKAHYLVHLCTHFYNEAKHLISIRNYKDINLIKLCDIREFIIKDISEEDFQIAINFCKKYQLHYALYFTMFFLQEIYSDGYEKRIMDALGIEDTRFLNTYGDSTIRDDIMHEKSLVERIFMCDGSKGNL